MWEVKTQPVGPASLPSGKVIDMYDVSHIDKTLTGSWLVYFKSHDRTMILSTEDHKAVISSIDALIDTGD